MVQKFEILFEVEKLILFSVFFGIVAETHFLTECGERRSNRGRGTTNRIFAQGFRDHQVKISTISHVIFRRDISLIIAKFEGIIRVVLYCREERVQLLPGKKKSLRNIGSECDQGDILSVIELGNLKVRFYLCKNI